MGRMWRLGEKGGGVHSLGATVSSLQYSDGEFYSAAKRLESYQEAVSEEEECTDTLSGSLGSVARPRAQSCRTAHSRLPGKPLAQLSGSTSAVGNGEGSGEVLHSRQAAFSSPIVSVTSSPRPGQSDFLL